MISEREVGFYEGIEKLKWAAKNFKKRIAISKKLIMQKYKFEKGLKKLIGDLKWLFQIVELKRKEAFEKWLVLS